MKVKLLSVWQGQLPLWFNKFKERMDRFRLVEWELVHPPGNRRRQVEWLNIVATKRLGIECTKSNWNRNAICDFRPAYAEIFPEKYTGCDWWGWCDLDVVFGDLDNLLPPILADEVEAVSFKQDCLSGCFVLLRNTERMRTMYRHGDAAKVLGDPNYHCWDESGYYDGSGEGFWHVMVREGVRIIKRQDLYLYDSPSERHGVRLENGKLFCAETGREAALFHFMSDRWPVGV